MPYLNERNGSGKLFTKWRLSMGWTDRGIMESELNLLGHGYSQFIVSNGELGKSFFQKGFLDWLLENKHMSQEVYDEIMAELKKDRIYQWEKKNGPIESSEPSNELVSELEVEEVEPEPVVEAAPEPVVAPPPVVETVPAVVVSVPVITPPPAQVRKRAPVVPTLILVVLGLVLVGVMFILPGGSGGETGLWLVSAIEVCLFVALVWIWLRWLKAR